eukprot:gene5965-4274_t
MCSFSTSTPFNEQQMTKRETWKEHKCVFFRFLFIYSFVIYMKLIIGMLPLMFHETAPPSQQQEVRPATKFSLQEEILLHFLMGVLMRCMMHISYSNNICTCPCEKHLCKKT